MRGLCKRAALPLLAAASVALAQAEGVPAEAPTEHKAPEPAAEAAPPGGQGEATSAPDAGTKRRRRRPDAGTPATTAADAGLSELLPMPPPPVLAPAVTRRAADAGSSASLSTPPPLVVTPAAARHSADAGTSTALAMVPASPAPAAARPMVHLKDAPAPIAEKARLFFGALLAGDPGPLVAQAQFPFYLEERRIDSAEQLRTEWLNQLRDKRTDLLSLRGFRVLTPDEMEQQFGKPPARLSSWPLRGGNAYLVVADVSGHAAVALYKLVGDDWRVAAYHD